MTRAQIEARIRFIQDRLSRVTHPQDIAACNRILEQLIMMEAEDDGE